VKYDSTKTVTDLEPYKFDPNGDRVTGELDDRLTPTMQHAKLDIPYWLFFMCGIAIGSIILASWVVIWKVTQ